MENHPVHFLHVHKHDFAISNAPMEKLLKLFPQIFKSINIDSKDKVINMHNRCGYETAYLLIILLE